MKPDAGQLFRWLMQASEGTFLRSQCFEVPRMSVLDSFEWPALLAAVLESSLLSSCPPDLNAVLVPRSAAESVPAAHNTHRRTTRGKGRLIRKHHEYEDGHCGAVTFDVF